MPGFKLVGLFAFLASLVSLYLDGLVVSQILNEAQFFQEERREDCPGIDDVCDLNNPSYGIPVVLVSAGRSGSSSTWETMSRLSGENYRKATEDIGSNNNEIRDNFLRMDPLEDGKCWIQKILCQHQANNRNLSDHKRAVLIGTKWKPYWPSFDMPKSREALQWIARHPTIKVVFSERNPVDSTLSRFKHARRFNHTLTLPAANNDTRQHSIDIKPHCSVNDTQCVQDHAAEAASLRADPKIFVERMREHSETNQRAKQVLDELQVPRVEVTYEELYYSDSAHEWKRILDFLGVPSGNLTMETVRSKMTSAATGSIDRSSKLSNWRQVETAIREQTDLDKYLSLPTSTSSTPAPSSATRGNAIPASPIMAGSPVMPAISELRSQVQPEALEEVEDRKLETTSPSMPPPTTTTPTNDGHSWRNDKDVVHVIHTRFMQHQPNLLELGRARLQLFETFCLPTMAHQTNQQFLWILRIDPELAPSLRDGLLQAIERTNMTNVAVVGSNAIRKGSYHGGFRGPYAVNDITPQSLLYGDSKLIESYANATQGRTLVETNLDADDGLGLEFVEKAQLTATSMFLSQQEKKNGWFYLCPGRHMEWQYNAPWDQETRKGSLRFYTAQKCVTPGMSWVTQASAKARFINKHHLIKTNTSSCTNDKWEVDASSLVDGCWTEIPVQGNNVMAIRARTPASVAMGSFLQPASDWNDKQVQSDKLSWTLLEPNFAIQTSAVQACHKQLKEHLHNVAQDNLKGQCTPGHSCNDSSKNRLNALLSQTPQTRQIRLVPTTGAAQHEGN